MKFLLIFPVVKFEFSSERVLFPTIFMFKTIGRIHSSPRKLSVNERANFNSVQIAENVEAEVVPKENRPVRPSSSRVRI